MLHHAKPEQLKEIYTHFYNHKTWFPHIRRDYLNRMICGGNMIYHEGVIITYNKYQRKNKIAENCHARKGDIILHQILNTCQFSGKASEVLKQFFAEVEVPVWLTVRADNEIAIKFYKKNGMKQVGQTSWLGGKIKGLVFLYQA